MHDDLIERRLRDALHGEGDRVALTITAAELERRWALRRRQAATRPMALLLAAAVGIGLVGVGAVVGGVFDRDLQGPSPAPSMPAVVAEASPSPAASPAAAGLPSLEQLTAGSDPTTIVLSQAHGPAAAPEIVPTNVELAPPSVQLALPAGDGQYEVLLACLSTGRMGAAVKSFDRLGETVATDIPCDGRVIRKPFDLTSMSGFLCLISDTPRVSWRVAVRKVSGTPVSIDGVTEPQIQAGELELARDADTDPGWPDRVAAVASDPAMAGDPIPMQALPSTEFITVRMSCSGGPVRFVLGDGTFGPEAPGTDTRVACDGVVHDHTFRIDEWAGDQFAIQADPSTHWQVVIVSDEPPIELAGDQPGWASSGGIGPVFTFTSETDGLTLPAGEKPGPMKVVVTCAGSGVLHVTVDLGRRVGEVTQSFDAPCDGAGATTERTFQNQSTMASVTYSHPARAWYAIGILIPDPGTAP
jgi:hypothetical protein